MKKTRSGITGLMIVTLMLLPNYTFGQQITIGPDIRMLALGDSYTIGENVLPEERWPHQFIGELIAAGIKSSAPDYIATTGWTTGDLLEGMETDLNLEKKYNLVSILIGVNNQYQGIPITNYEPDLKEIIENALYIVGGDHSKVFILSIPDYAFTPFGEGKKSISKEIDNYNSINKNLAEAFSIPWIDITPISRMGLSDTSLIAGDRLHPSASQYRKWVLELMPRLHFYPSSGNVIITL
jgi:lysophospholipase L1-like esterase